LLVKVSPVAMKLSVTYECDSLIATVDGTVSFPAMPD
jgi:hypothetical protein